jgi:hypothetical protein
MSNNSCRVPLLACPAMTASGQGMMIRASIIFEPIYGSFIPRSRQIFRAGRLLISLWRAAAQRRRFAGLACGGIFGRKLLKPSFNTKTRKVENAKDNQSLDFVLSPFRPFVVKLGVYSIVARVPLALPVPKGWIDVPITLLYNREFWSRQGCSGLVVNL